MKRYDDVMAEIRQRKRERWVEILASEPTPRGAGRRPRDPEQERMLLRLDRARIARREASGDLRITQLPAAAEAPEPEEPGVEPTDPR